MPRSSSARAVADVTAGTIIATVGIDAPPERVFRALTSSEITAWWGAPGVYQTTTWSGDVAVGGRWRASGVGADGKPFAVEGEYLEIDAPRKLVHTWKPDWAGGEATTVTYRLEPEGAGTRVTLRHEGFRSPDACQSHGDGWTMVLGWLSGFLAPPAKRSYFVVRLLPPRPTFVVDMTEAERRIMGEHVAYWTGKLQAGQAVAFGPVLDPKGPWGLGVVELTDPSELGAWEREDPAIAAGIGMRYEVLPMAQAIVRP